MTNKTTEALKLSLPALENAESVAASISAGKRHAIQVDEETCFWQREEWVRWAIDEVLPEIRQALAAIREALEEQESQRVQVELVAERLKNNFYTTGEAFK